MNRCLRNVALKLGDADLQERVEKLIAEETTQLDRTLAPYRACKESESFSTPEA